MILVQLHEDAKGDLLRRKVSDGAAVATIVAFLQEVKALGSQAPNVLTTEGDGHLCKLLVNIKEWKQLSKLRPRPNVWRVRILDSPATSYRVFYGYHYPTKQLVVLAALKKVSDTEFEDDFDYDNLASPVAQRIIAAWRQVG